MAQDSSDSGGQGDWQKRLDALSQRLLGMESQVQRIHADLQQLRREIGMQAAQNVLAEPSPPNVRPPAAPPTVRPAGVSHQEKPSAALPHRGRSGAPTPSAGVTMPAGPATPSATKASSAASEIGGLEARIGGAWLSWLGGLCVMIAAAWFFKYAVEQGWIKPWLRVGTGWILGAILLGLGEWSMRRGMPWFAAGVTGAGLGLGYIAGYAASPLLYDLIPLTGSYAVLGVVTVVGLIQAVRLSQLPAAVLALLGGLLTLVLLKSPHPTAAGLLGYLIALNVGALAAGQIRRWPHLRYLGWAGTAPLIALWLAGTHVPGEELLATLPLLSLLFALFQLDIVLWRLRKPDETSTSIGLLAGLNGTGLLLAIHAAVRSDEVASIVGTSFFAVAVFQIVLARALWLLSGTERNRRVAISFYAQGSLAAAVGLPVAFDRFLIALGWSAQAVTIAWLVRHVRAVWLRLGIAGLIAASLLYIVTNYHETFLLLGPRVLGLQIAGRTWLAAVVSLAGGVCGGLMARWYAQSNWWLDRAVGEVCTLLAAAALALLTYRAQFLRTGYLMVVALLAAAWIILIDCNSPAGIFRSQPWRWTFGDFGPLLPAGLVLAGLGFWGSWLCRHARTRDAAGPVLSEIVLAAASLGLLGVLLNQLADDGPAYAVLAAAGVSAALAVLGRTWNEPAFGVWSGLTWVAAALYWIGAATLAARFDGVNHVAAGWTQVMPFTNSTFAAGIALILIAWPVSASFARSAGVQRSGAAVYAAVPPLLSAYLLLHATSFEVDRWCQVYAPGQFADPANAERVALSVLWALLALGYVVGGLIFSIRGLRLMGLTLFAITAAKVLLLDMARVAVLYRVLSAMGLGVLSLAGSYAYQRVRRIAAAGTRNQ